jgi:hypothetical protein
MFTVTREAHTAQFTTALLDASCRAIAAYPAEKARIQRGLDIVIHDGVVLEPDGTALVASQGHPGMTYRVNGQCECPDVQRAPEGRCKHRYAKALYKAALAAMKRHPGPQRWYATYTAPSGEAIPGVAELDTQMACYLFIPDDGGEPLYPALAALSLGGHIPTEQAQRDADGDLAAKLGQPQYPAVDLDAAQAELASIKAARLARQWGA